VEDWPVRISRRAMTLDTIVFDPTPCGFPRPRVPPLPDGHVCLSIRASSRRQESPVGTFRDFSRGRYALREAYRLAGVDSRSTLLAPAYHCRTMIDPALALNAEVLLYPLSEVLAPVLPAIDQLHRQSAKPVKALLATHFFGIPQALRDLAKWCAERDIVLIEDCSHALFYRNHQPHGMGNDGRFVVSSPYKFIASPDGGLLYAQDEAALSTLKPHARSQLDELRAVAWTLTSIRQRRHQTYPPLDTELAPITRTEVHPGHEVRQQAGVSGEYRSQEEGRASSRCARLLHRFADPDCIARRRRERYQQWSAALAGLPGCRPLYPLLPEDCIPYMFPLLIERPQPHFYWLKRLGMPIWRWDSIVASSCPTATRYRLHLLHLPCHQSIADADMVWMSEAVRKVIANQNGALAK